MLADHLNETLAFHFPEGLSGNGGIHLHTIHQDGWCDQLVSGNLLEQLIIGGLIQGDGIVGLLLDLSLGPLLLLGLATTGARACLGIGLFLCLEQKSKTTDLGMDEKGSRRKRHDGSHRTLPLTLTETDATSRGGPFYPPIHPRGSRPGRREQRARVGPDKAMKKANANPSP